MSAGPRVPPTRCSDPECTNLTDHGRCPEHQRPPWRQRSRYQRGTTAQRRRVKAHVFARDHGRCHVCGQSGATQMDHIIPLHLGGAEWDTANLAPVHEHCHNRKSRAENAARNRARQWRD